MTTSTDSTQQKLTSLESMKKRAERLLENNLKKKEDAIASLTQNGLYWSNAEQLANSEEMIVQLNTIILILGREIPEWKTINQLEERLELITDTLLRGPEVSSTSMFSNAIGLSKFEARREIRKEIQNILYALKV